MKKNKNKKKNTNYVWIAKITLIAFLISFLFSGISETILPNTPLVLGIILVFVFIILGVIFDMVGVAVTSSDEKQFHSMSARKVKGAKTAVGFKKNAEKVASFCNDVIGDICGIISGSAGVMIATNISMKLNLHPFWVSLTVTALIAALTIGGKALGKGVAIAKGNNILFMFSKIISLFKREK
ncbi:MAG: hypothetical protein E7165_00705 [Firmicutes bacterium]|nr:hypothetical protein [Bacillota bacterium]